MRKRVGFSLLTNVVTAFFPLALILIVSKKMEVGDFGKLSLWISLVVLFSGVADLGFSTAMISDYNSRGPNGIKAIVYNYNRSFYSWLTIFGSILWGILLLGRARLGLSLMDAGYLWVSAISATVYRYLSSQYMASGKVRSLFFNTLTVAAVRLGSIGLIVWVIGNTNTISPSVIFPLYLLGLLVGLALLALDHNIYWLQALKNHTNSYRHLRKVFWIGLTNTVILGRTRGDLAIAQLYFPVSQVAIYSVANTLASGVNLFTGAIIDNYIPILGGKTQKTGIAIMIRHLAYALPVVLLLCILGWVASPSVVRLLAGVKYIPSIPILRVLLFGYIGAMAFVPLEAYLYVFKPNRVFIIKATQFILFIVFIFILAPRHSVQILGIIGVMVSMGGWGLGGYFLLEAWIKVRSEQTEGVR